MQTADHIEAPTEQPVDDTVEVSPSGVGAPTARSRRLTRVLVGCLAAEAVLVVTALVLWSGSTRPADESSTADATGPVAPVAPVAATADDVEPFLRAWERSIAPDLGSDHDYEATGTLTRSILGRDALYSSAWPDPDRGAEGTPPSVWPYRHRRSGGRTFTRIGDTATIVDPAEGRLTCIERTEGLVCSPDEGGNEAEKGDHDTIAGGDATVATVAAVAQTVRGATSTHRIDAIDANDILAAFPRLPTELDCWEARSLTDGVGQRWGRRAQFCFHGPTGAAVFRRILGTTRLEVLVVDSVSEETNLGP